MKKDIVLQVDPNFTYSINTQIKEQLKWLIGLGYIQPGQLLPPAGQLADKLNVNRNTVNLVYTQLRDEGIVSIMKGRGTQVMEGPVSDELRAIRRPMYELLTRMMEEAIDNGVNLKELGTASFAFLQLFNYEAVLKMKILFIECREHDYYFYKTQVEQETNAEVSTLFLEEIASNPKKLDEAADKADIVVTTLNHIDEVKELLSGKHVQILTIGATANISILMDIAKMDVGSKVVFVCLGNQGGKWMAERVKEAGIGHIESIAMGMDNNEALRKAIKQSKCVYASSAVYDEIMTLAPEKAALFPLVLEKSSEKLLKDLAR
jgi:DNA-binding transcriptional regulator YhcF (GntR family)